MYYIRTADRLTRTSVWLENMEGGIDYLRDVIVNDRLGIAAELEQQMQALVDSYQCEWKAVVDDPEKRRFFQQFANTDDAEPGVEFVSERGQQRPAGWPSDFVPLEQISAATHGRAGERIARARVRTRLGSRRVGERLSLVTAAARSSTAMRRSPSSGSIRRGEWYACQNICPHKREVVLSRGILGDQQGVPKVACPLHKKTFSLESGECLSGESYQVEVFPVRVESDDVYVELPPAGGDATPHPSLPGPALMRLRLNDSSPHRSRSLDPMNLREFRRAGHAPTLLGAFLYFDVSFMVWLLPGALANSIVPDFGLSDCAEGLDGGRAAARRGRAPAGARPPDRPHRRASDHHPGDVPDDASPAPRLALGGWLRQDVARRPAAGRGGSQLRRGAATGEPLVSAAVSGAGDGDRRRRQQRYRAGHVLRPAARRDLGLARRVRPGTDPARWSTLALFLIFAKDSPDQPPPRSLSDYAAVLKLARHLVVLPLLRDHVRRIRRAGELPQRLLPEPVRAFEGRGGQLRDALRDRRLVRCGRSAVISPTSTEASGC